MMKEWLNWMNMGVAALIGLLLLLAFFLMTTNHIPIELHEELKSKSPLPASSFEQPEEAYQSLGESALQLKTSPIGLQLPDLRKTLVYYGRNNRPDADPNTTVMHFSFIGNKTYTPIPPKTHAYIVYDKSQSPPRYEFSPENKETSLWIEAHPEGNNAVVNVKMKNDAADEIITTPAAYATFSLPEKPIARIDSTAWEIGKFRVDGTLLTRQKARWVGTDKFIERHGGKEYEHLIGKQRIDFDEGNKAYSVYVQNGDVLAWDNNRWNNAIPGPDTLGKPLLVVKKLEERLMSFDLWDNDGKAKITLNMLKTSEPPPQINVLQNFKFLGSRTRSQFVFEINKERITLSPLDWILYSDKEWKKLTSVDDIDAYVENKLTGLLFIFDGIEKRDEQHQIMIGTLFNKSRSDFIDVEMAMETGSTLSPATGGTPPPAGKSQPKKGNPETSDEKSPNLEIHPHTKEEMREYQNHLRER